MTERTSPSLTETSKALFVDYAKDAGNWSGAPLVGGNVASDKELRGNLTQLKRAGLLGTQYDREERCTWVVFTEKGVRYAATLGIDLRPYYPAPAEANAQEERR